MSGPAVLFRFDTDPPIPGMVFALDKMADGVSDFSGLLEGYDELFRLQMRRQFADEGILAGGWAPLTPAYAEWKEANFPGQPIGVLHGWLRAAMTGGDGYRADISSDSASYGMDASSKAVSYGQHFAERRPVLIWGTQQSREFQKYAHEWLHFEIQSALGKMPHGAKNPAVPGALGGL